MLARPGDSIPDRLWQSFGEDSGLKKAKRKQITMSIELILLEGCDLSCLVLQQGHNIFVLLRCFVELAG